MDKWKKAVIHLECTADSESYHEREARIEELDKEREHGEIDDDEYMRLRQQGIQDVRPQGTSVFVEHNKNHYLITARHVLWDETTAVRNYNEALERAERFQDWNLDSAVERYHNEIFSRIFRVPTLDDAIKGELGNQAFLMNLNNPPCHSYSLISLDLGVISFTNRNRRFFNEITRFGHEPIMFDDIADGPSAEGAEVFTVGFPGSTSLLGQRGPIDEQPLWWSKYFSLPTFSFGRVAMLHDELFFYWTDMSIYPGNSGGPVIENDKMVGIVSAQPAIPVENSEDLEVRIPFGKIIKTKYIKDLIIEQEKKDINIKSHYRMEKPLNL